MSEYIPKLKQISVSPDKLILDPNNPRLITRDDDLRDEKEAILLGPATFDKMRGINSSQDKDPYHIKELESSIKQNGWVPIDFIFVKKYDSAGTYLVLEGNRRVTAIKNIIQDTNNDRALLDALASIEVMEIVDDISKEQLQNKITYLLGVRHHGSLKKWSAFAQANNIYNRYLELSYQQSESFLWNKDVGEKTADALSVDLKEIESRLRVFRAMEQIGNAQVVKESLSSGGGMKDKYYSICEEVLLGNKVLKQYIRQDPNSFYLDEESVEKMISLCHFDKPDRLDAPISDPQEWRKFKNILKDPDVNKREEMLNNVLVNKQKPSDVWADRVVEITTPRWDHWLKTVNAELSRILIGDDLSSQAAKEVVQRLMSLIEKLESVDN